MDQVLELAYKYPFSNEAKEVVKSHESSKIDPRYLELGRLRVNEAITKGVIEFSEASNDELKLDYVISYVYARMIASAISIAAVEKYVSAEAKRSAQALSSEKTENIIHIANELGITVEENGELFAMPFTIYLLNMPKSDEYRLIHQKLSNGIVYLERYKLIRILETAFTKAIHVGMPIPKENLPKEVIEVSKTIKVPVEEIKIKTKKSVDGRYAWIEKLLAHPLPDFRHRVVNLILAPYFANVRGLNEEEATKIITQYIEKCKELNPNTRVGESYIAYQVRYAKRKGLKPLSLNKAKELLGGIINFDELS
ncbi:MAG: DNA primase noncatalytic subunit PriX [Candidatus Micrarchaeota archaeon]